MGVDTVDDDGEEGKVREVVEEGDDECVVGEQDKTTSEAMLPGMLT